MIVRLIYGWHIVWLVYCLVVVELANKTVGRNGRRRFGSRREEGRRTRQEIETNAAPRSRQAMVVDGRTLVKAGQEATASGGYGLDKGPAIARTRCQEIEGQERAFGRPAPSTHLKRPRAAQALAQEKMVAQVRSATCLERM